MSISSIRPADLPVIIRFLEREAVALVSSKPAEALRLALLAREVEARAHLIGRLAA
jgi:hypothetical protein